MEIPLYDKKTLSDLARRELILGGSDVVITVTAESSVKEKEGKK